MKIHSNTIDIPRMSKRCALFSLRPTIDAQGGLGRARNWGKSEKEHMLQVTIARKPACTGVWRSLRVGRNKLPIVSSSSNRSAVVQQFSVQEHRPVVRRLSTQELSRLLPWSGCGARLVKEVGDLGACTRRVALSLVFCLLVYGNSIELASVAGFYWAWAPICSTALSNLPWRLRYQYAGVWSAKVARVQILPPQKFVAGEGNPLSGNLLRRLSQSPSTLEIKIGDGIATNVVVQVPLTDELPDVQVGESVELMVVSDKPSLSRFRALHDVFFPERGVWISEEPAVQRKEFEQNCLEYTYGLPTRRRGERVPVKERSALYLEENSASKDAVRLEGPLKRESLGKFLEEDYSLDLQEKSPERRQEGKRLEDADLYF